MAELPAETRMGAVELTVGDLERSLAYYRSGIGLGVLEQDGGRATLGADGTELLCLVEEPGARPAPRNTGLFHFALLLPERPELARWLAHAIRERVPLTGVSDHAVSEALYLRDPDEHGIEIYADRPRELWQGRVRELMTTQPLDLESLLGELDDPETEPFDALPAGTTMGHVHFQVADIPETTRFYRDILGFELMAGLPSAAFLAAGGYHHHVGANTWNSAGAQPPPEGAAALRRATIVLPDAQTREDAVRRVADEGQEPEDTPEGPVVRDPSGNSLLLA